MMIYLMNERARIRVNTHVGNTRMINAKENVKQGTVFGPKLCSVVTQSE